MPSSVTARHRSLAVCVATICLLACGLVATGDTPAPAASSPVVTAQDAVRLNKPSPLVLSAPRSVTAGGKIRFVGDVVVKARKPRRVQVDELTARGWRAVAKATSKRNGTFNVRISAGSRDATRVFRAEAPAARGLAGLRTGKLRVKVTKAAAPVTGPTVPGTATYDAAEALPAEYVAAGSKTDWSSLFGAESTRWDPCTVIRWRYNAAGESYDARADVTRAIAKISGVSGLKFKYVGTSTFSYRGQEHPNFPDDADIFVSWAGASNFGALAGSTVGVGGGYATSQGAGSLGVDWRMKEGYLTLDKGASQIAAGFDGSGWGQIVMHEMLHALGLGHAASDPNSREVMAPIATSLNYRFGAGDLTGMHNIGERPGDNCVW